MRIEKYDMRLSNDRLPMLVKEASVNYPGNRREMRNPSEVVKYLREVESMSDYPEEHVLLLCYDTKLHLIGTFNVSVGTVDRAIVDPGAVYKRALALGANNILLAHNHPSGDPTPSKQDFETKDRIKQAGIILGINLVDFVIVGEPGYYSCVESGML